MGELKDVRRAAREAGRRLGCKGTTHLVGGRLFVLDEREAPEEIERLAANAAAAAIRAWEEGRRPRLEATAFDTCSGLPRPMLRAGFGSEWVTRSLTIETGELQPARGLFWHPAPGTTMEEDVWVHYGFTGTGMWISPTDGRWGGALDQQALLLPRPRTAERCPQRPPKAGFHLGTNPSWRGTFRSDGSGDPVGGGRVACGFGSEPAFHSSTRSAVRLRSRAAALCRDRGTRGGQCWSRSRRASCGTCRDTAGAGRRSCLYPAGPRL